mmetsp:Transcript_31440/g.54689  ORF Transcript_31440/g.54689 Transcript_31440/m.54689 type:complete len:87 (-) Transcript_31440:505-765(-)
MLRRCLHRLSSRIAVHPNENTPKENPTHTPAAYCHLLLANPTNAQIPAPAIPTKEELLGHGIAQGVASASIVSAQVAVLLLGYRDW